MKKEITTYLVGCIVALILTTSLNRTVLYKLSTGPATIGVVCIISATSWLGVASIGCIAVSCVVLDKGNMKKLTEYVEAKDKLPHQSINKTHF